MRSLESEFCAAKAVGVIVEVVDGERRSRRGRGGLRGVGFGESDPRKFGSGLFGGCWFDPNEWFDPNRFVGDD